ncbi:MAG: fibronectin type III domain-containing protein, partial [Deltaproteobacteria bacterium]|nr:fibronectin type III domain-containing protein [Deltaproteobacteria bacterium]
MYRTESFLKLVTRAFLFTILAAVGAQTQLFAAQITLNWTDNSNNEDGFRIERRTGTSGSFAQITVVAADTTSYVDNGLADATTYCYRVNAYDSAGTSAYTNVPCATTPSAPPTSYLLSITKAGTGSGTVTSSPSGINCGTTCSGTYNSGASVALTAVPASGSTFAGWSGGGCTGTGSCTVTMSGATTVTATFNLNPPTSYLLTVSNVGTGSGTVTSSPSGINCGTTCSGTYNSGASVALTAVPASGSTFAGWSGGGCTGTGSCTVTMSGATMVTATFNLNPLTLYLLTVSKAGTGSGKVTATGIDCGSDCSESFTSATRVTLAAKAANGSTFAGWTGEGCSTRFTVNGDMNCTATFNLKTFVLKVTKSGKGSGNVTSTDIDCGISCSETFVQNSIVSAALKTTKIDCGSTCVENVYYGNSVLLTAAPANGSLFAGWRGAGCNSTVMVNRNVTCTAIFNPIPYTLTVSKAGTGSGRVTARGMNCGEDCNEIYLNGSSIRLNARPDRGSHFVGWTGQGCDSTVIIAGDMNCTATFNLNIYEVAVLKAGTGSGTVTAAGINCGSDCSEGIAHGSSVVLKATPAIGSRFAGWKGSRCGTGTFAITGPMTCTATFIDVLALMDRIGVYRASTGEWFLDRNATQTWENG